MRRGCAWEHPTRGHLVYKTFGKDWRDLFGAKLPQQVKTLLQQAMQTLHASIRREVVQGGCRQEAEVAALQEGWDFSSSVSGRALAHKFRRVFFTSLRKICCH